MTKFLCDENLELYGICFRKCNKNGKFSSSEILIKFGQRPCTIIVHGLWSDFGATSKFVKNSILIGITSKFLYQEKLKIKSYPKYPVLWYRSVFETSKNHNKSTDKKLSTICTVVCQNSAGNPLLQHCCILHVC